MFGAGILVLFACTRAQDGAAGRTDPPSARAATVDLESALKDARDHMARAKSSQDPSAAHAELETAIPELLAAPGSADSKTACDLLLQLGQGAHRFDDPPLARAAFEAVVAERSRRLSADDADVHAAQSGLAAQPRDTGEVARVRAT